MAREISGDFQKPFSRPGFREVRVSGWLSEQLKIQASGLTGHIDEIWGDLGPDSGWLGGKGESWERGPYYLDGLLPLAWLLDDARLKTKAQKWIEAILGSMDGDGSFGPRSNRDWWPRMVALKALESYHEATGDDRVLDFMLRYFRYEHSRLKSRPFADWAAARGGENALPALWLHESRPEPFLLDLAGACLDHTIPWEEVFSDFPYREPTDAYLPRALFLPFKFFALLKENALKTKTAKGKPDRRSAKKIRKANSSRSSLIYHRTHNVDYAMALKFPAISRALAGLSGPSPETDLGLENAMRFHGLANGMWSGDEHFNGREPTQGSELCGIVELMHTAETLIEYTGEAKYADLLERLAFNALPAAFDEDMNVHQYLQQANQVLVDGSKRPWYDNGKEALLFGLAPEYGCCAANMHQGFPKFARSIWLRGDRALACVLYVPSTLSTEVHGVPLEIELKTGYPVSGEVSLAFTIPGRGEIKFPLLLRIPGWAEGARLTINNSEPLPMGRAGRFFRVERVFHDGDIMKIYFPMKIVLRSWIRDSISVERGALVFALAVRERWKSLRGKAPYDYRAAYPESAWNYALVLDGADVQGSFALVEKAPTTRLFSRENPPIEIIARAKRLDSWKLQDNSAGPIPRSPVESDSEEELVSLIPYGCARLRISQFPWSRA